jgi:hypothetical protein
MHGSEKADATPSSMPSATRKVARTFSCWRRAIRTMPRSPFRPSKQSHHQSIWLPIKATTATPCIPGGLIVALHRSSPPSPTARFRSNMTSKSTVSATSPSACSAASKTSAASPLASIATSIPSWQPSLSLHSLLGGSHESGHHYLQISDFKFGEIGNLRGLIRVPIYNATAKLCWHSLMFRSEVPDKINEGLNSNSFHMLHAPFKGLAVPSKHRKALH